MSLADMIKGKRHKDAFPSATAIPAMVAIPRVQPLRSVARIATVAVANPATSNPAPLTPDEENAIHSWLAQIEETDPVEIARVVNKCQRDEVTRAYVLTWAAANPKPAPLPDDRRTCNQCANLMGERCAAAFRGDLSAARNYEPLATMPKRCAGYAPGAADTDRRSGHERWPGLTDMKGGK